MKSTEEWLNEQRDQIQNDLLCILDGLDKEILYNVFQVIVDRFEILKQSINTNRE